MLNRTKTLSATMILALGSALALGCAGSDGDPTTGGPRKPAADESAVLTIVGDQNLLLEPSQRKSLSVKYHDEAGGPLGKAVRDRGKCHRAGRKQCERDAERPLARGLRGRRAIADYAGHGACLQ